VDPDGTPDPDHRDLFFLDLSADCAGADLPEISQLIDGEQPIPPVTVATHGRRGHFG
jgi:hypothetical protein